MKNASPPSLALLVILAMLGVGCGRNCKDDCEEQIKCDGSPLADVDCDKYCEKLEKLNEEAGCEDQYDDVLRCSSDQDDVCKGDACSSEFKAYGECRDKYCSKHPDECAKLFE